MLHLVGAGVAPSASGDSSVKTQRHVSSGSSRSDDAAGQPVMSLNNGICAGVTPPSATQISLDTLFKGASRHCDSNDINLFRFGTCTHYTQRFNWVSRLLGWEKSARRSWTLLERYCLQGECCSQ